MYLHLIFKTWEAVSNRELKKSRCPKNLILECLIYHLYWNLRRKRKIAIFNMPVFMAGQNHHTWLEWLSGIWPPLIIYCSEVGGIITNVCVYIITHCVINTQRSASCFVVLTYFFISLSPSPRFKYSLMNPPKINNKKKLFVFLYAKPKGNFVNTVWSLHNKARIL